MRTVITLSIGAAGGVLGHLLELPAGAMLGAIAAVGCLNLVRDGYARVPPAVTIAGRTLIGATVGSLVTVELLRALGRNVPWAIGFTVLVLAIGLVGAIMVADASGLDRRTALLAACPGGMPEMSALAEELGTDVDVVVGVHLVRKIVTLAAVLGTAALLGLL